MSTIDFEVVCPACQDRLNQATTLNTDQPVHPKEGDVTICATCLAVLEFDKEIQPSIINIKSLEPDIQDMIVTAIVHLSANKPTLH